jgi:hypothetical protein
VHGQPAQPFDAVIVPGCPSAKDGRLTHSQMERAIWASVLFQRGEVKNIIVSGAAVHSPFVEAEALAEALAALEVPEGRIYLEPNALHTDENMSFSIEIAECLGFRSLAVASHQGHVDLACRLSATWGQACVALPADRNAVSTRVREVKPRLDPIRSRREALWVPLAERERRTTGGGWRRRPPSFIYYPLLAWRRLGGKIVRPKGPAPRVVTWAEARSRIARSS